MKIGLQKIVGLKNMSKKAQENLIVAILIAVGFYAANYYMLGTHELWRDEAQAWLLARDCSISELFGMMKSEGHPVLWHLLMFPFAKMGFAAENIGLISLALTTLGVAVVALFAPCGYAFKISFALLCSYQLSVISRSYSLAVLGIALLICLYKYRHERPVLYAFLLFFLTQIHIIFEGLAIGLIIISFYEAVIDKQYRKDFRQYLPCAFGLLGVLIIAIFLSGCNSGNMGALLLDGPKALKRLYDALTEIGINTTDIRYAPIAVAGVALLKFVFVAYLFCIKKRYKELFLFCCTFGAMALVHEYVFLSSIQRAICFVLCVFLFMVIIMERSAKENELTVFEKMLKFAAIASYTLLFVCATEYIFVASETDSAKPFSDAFMVSEVLKEKYPDGVVVVTNSDALSGAVLAYDEKAVGYSLSRGEYYTYVDWTKELYSDMSGDEIRQFVETELPTAPAVVFLCDVNNIPDGLLQDMTCVLFRSNSDICSDEMILLYRLR